MKCLFPALFFLLSGIISFAEFKLEFDMSQDEKWWGGYNALGSRQPFGDNINELNLERGTYGNLAVPFLVSNKGRFVYSQKPFRFSARNRTMFLQSRFNKLTLEKSGETLKSAYLAAAKKYFVKPNATLPNELFFSMPQYNTWIELTYNQNQEDILKYAKNIVKHGFPPGVFMIDDCWQKTYGNYEFDPKKFEDPKGMIEELHALGFKVMLWIVPYVNLDTAEFKILSDKNMLVRSRDTQKPLPIKWWNGTSAAYDLTNPQTLSYLKSTLEGMRKKYGVDGFKLDGGEHLYTEDALFYQKDARGWDYLKAWTSLAESFSFNELRSNWNSPNAAVVQRLADKRYGWSDLQALIPDMIATGLLGSAYACPDMIGGGEYKSFENLKNIDEALIVRSCQVHSLMPMMQFSVAPWRILSPENVKICAEYAHLHKTFSPYILQLAKESSNTCEPIVRAMEYEFPNEDFAQIKDQFMLGDKYLVAPILSPENSRTVKLPKGKWKDDLGKVHDGGITIKVEAPLDRLPYFERI